MNPKMYPPVKMTIMALAAMVFFLNNVTAQTYCVPTFNGVGCSDTMAIRNVTTTGGDVNFNNSSTCGSGSYTDYTINSSMLVKQDAGQSVDVKVTVPSHGSGSSGIVQVYVDWNRNGIFDLPAEEIPQPTQKYLVHTTSNPPGQSVTVKVNVPGDAKNGLTRMRIMVASSGPVFTFGALPCSSPGKYGEVEDYNFEVVNPCLPPNVISFSDLDQSSVTVSWTKKLNAEEYEYLLKKDATPPPAGTFGYNYSQATSLKLDKLDCNVKYYFFMRTVCDKKGPSPNWEYSDWIVDSFTTHQCCHIPDIKVKNITSSTAVAEWDPIPSAYGYEYAVTVQPAPPTPPVQAHYTTSNRVQLQGLQPGTSQFIFVRSRCNPTPLSGWGEYQFKTLPYTSVTELNTFNIQVYPNPVGNELHIVLPELPVNDATITITDVSGKVVYNKAVNSKEITVNTAALSPGMYFLKYHDGQHSSVIKIVK